MIVAIRVDASRLIGSGHVIRCLTLAEELRRHGVSALFVVRAHEGHLIGLIQGRGFATHVLAPGPPHRVSDGPYAEWLGVPWEIDAAATCEAVVGQQVDWLITDHYGLDVRWENVVRAAVGRIMVIDDLADRRHDAEILLDQNLLPESQYDDLVPPTCTLLVGTRFALLQSDYAELRAMVAPRSGRISRLLVFFGASDPQDLTSRALVAIEMLATGSVAVDVVASSQNARIRELERRCQRMPNVRLYRDVPTLASLVARADLAVGAAGVSNWERLCLGLPALVITFAANQVPVARALAERELIMWLGDAASVDARGIADALAPVLRDGLDERWSRRCLAVVDGRGAARVCSALVLDGDSPLEARPVERGDEALLLRWANDPTTRRNAFNTATITPESHAAWFRARLAAPESCRFFVVETTEQLPVGQVRFELKAGVWEIDYAVAPAYRGRGVGRTVLRVGIARLRQQDSATPIVGRVKEQNVSSQRVFEQLGFMGSKRADVIEYMLSPP